MGIERQMGRAVSKLSMTYTEATEYVTSKHDCGHEILWKLVSKAVLEEAFQLLLLSLQSIVK